MQTITLELNDELFEDLLVAARDREETPAETARVALADYLHAYMLDVEAAGVFS